MHTHDRLACHGAFIAALIAAVGGCSSQRPPQSGFLTNYEALTPHASRAGAFLYEHPTAKISSYRGFLIEPVVVSLTPEAQERSVDPQALERLAEYFRRELIAAIPERFAVVEAPGPGVLRIRAAITDATPRAVFSNLHPRSAATEGNARRTTIEAELVDAETNERIVAIVDTQLGAQFKYDIHWSQWGNVEGALRQWALLLRERLEQE